MRAHKSTCFYCKKLIESLELLEIDHIIPEHLEQTKLDEVLTKLGKPDFEVNSYFNWVPAHRGCNGDKSDWVFDEGTLRFYLELVRKKEPAVREEEERFNREAIIKDSLARVREQIEAGTLPKDTAIAFLEGSSQPEHSKADPWILSFSINLAKSKTPAAEFASVGEILMASDPEKMAPDTNDIPAALIRELESAFLGLNVLVVQSEAPTNNGETLSVRFAVWLLDLDRVPDKWPNRWKLLEIASFSEVYPDQNSDVLSDRAAIIRRNAVLLDEGSNDPLNYRYCPECSSTKLSRSSHNTPKETIYFIKCKACGWGERF